MWQQAGQLGEVGFKLKDSRGHDPKLQRSCHHLQLGNKRGQPEEKQMVVEWKDYFPLTLCFTICLQHPLAPVSTSNKLVRK